MLKIHPADVEDFPAILKLLDNCGLPRDGLAGHLPTTLVARDGKRIVGCSAIELYKEFALLRSVAVEQ